MSKSREWLGKAVFEAALITFSILFALWVDDWKEERDHRDLAQQALANFEREILDNQARVKKQLEYHLRLQGSLRAVLQNPDPIRTLEQTRQEIQFRGLAPPIFFDTAWQTAVATQALTYLDYETVSALSSIYSLQNIFNKVAESALSGLMSNISQQQPMNAVQQVYMTMGDFTGLEKQLLQTYDLALKQIRKKKRPEPAT